jgi:hypothetical protein
MVVEDTQIRRICVVIYSLVPAMRLASGWPVGVPFREPVSLSTPGWDFLGS